MDAGMMQVERNGGAGFVGLAWCLFQHPGPMGARYIYAALFLISNFYAWWLRVNPKPFFRRQRLSGCHGDRDCLASEAVLIISCTYFLYSLLMFITTVNTKNIHDWRNSWHSGWWPAKGILLLGCFLISTVAPAPLIQLYGKVAHFGAGIFLFIQLISVIRYITRLNSRWCGQANFENHHRKVNTISILAYGCSMVGIILMVFWYVGCYVNAALVFSTVLLVYIMPLMSLLSKAKGFYMEPLLMGLYIVFLCWSAIKSQPETSCYEKENTGSGVNWITMISFIAELASITVATFSTGTDYKCMQFTNVALSENDVPYGYGFFHFVFATGSMYFGMLFVGWDTHHPLGKWSMDVSWTSAIAHLVNEGLAVIFFMMVILARTYGVGWLQQLLGKMFGIGGQQQNADEPRATERERIEMGNIRPPQEPRTEDERTDETDNNRPPQEPRLIEPVGTDETTRNAAQPSSSTTTMPLRVSESSLSSSVLGSQSSDDEIEEVL